MFNFSRMVGNYAERAVARNEFDWGFISTCSVTDGDKPYETAVKHTAYHTTDMTIVESYDTKQEAKEGHDKWLKIMTSDKLPDTLVDCYNAGVAQLAKAIGSDLTVTKKQ